MKKISILLVIITILYADSIKFEDTAGKISTIQNIKYLKIQDGKVYYKMSGSLFTKEQINNINCLSVIKITDSKNHNIDYDCSTSSVSAQSFIHSGKELVKFHKSYFTGWLIAIAGNIYSITSPANATAGAVINLIGGITMFSSLNNIRNAGEDLIEAGRELEKEQSTESKPYEETSTNSITD